MAGKFELKKSKDGQIMFNLKVTNGQEVGRSEYSSSKSAMENGIASVMKNAPEATIDDITA